MLAVCAWLIALPALAQGATLSPVTASPAVLQDDNFCLGCHGTETHAKGAPLVEAGVLNESAHEAIRCSDCHTAIRIIPHHAPVAPVDCTRCHAGDTKQASLKAQAGREAPLDQHSEVTQEGAKGLPHCTNCHGTHDIQAPSAAHSHVGRTNIPDTCGACHTKEAGLYRQSIHGALVAEANRDVPTCVTCHPEHARLGEKGVFQRGVVKTCVSCHENAALQAKYALSADRLASYLGSYHGMATQLGDKRTANCVSCHGNHFILPSADARSATNPANLPKTCGQCHPKVNENVTRGKVHVMAEPGSSGLLYRINVTFKWFTLCTIGMLVGHIALELSARMRGRHGGWE